MMINLFSTFDPSSSYYFSNNWIIIIMIFLMFPSYFYPLTYPLMFIFSDLLYYLKKEFKGIMGSSLVDGSMNFILAFLIFIMMSNILGLLPFVFTSTSHMIVTLLLAMSIWWAFFLFRVIFFLNNFFSHLLPTGTPKLLMIFMVLIEAISLMIRPITLSIRLSANMIAGHLLLTLLGSSFFIFHSNFHILLYIMQSLLLILEMAVAMIQSYVFVMLMILYSMEI